MNVRRLAGRLLLHRWTATLHWKVALFICLMSCLLAATLGVLVHGSVSEQSAQRARKDAVAELDAGTLAYVAGDSLKAGVRLDPPGLPVTLRRAVHRGERGTQLGEDAGRPVMWAAGPAADHHVIAAKVDYTVGAARINGLDRSILGSSVLAIAVTLLVGILAVSRITRRLHRTAQVARQISAGDLDARIDDARTGNPMRTQDEVAAVSEALDTMAASLQRRLQSEQRFTADVAHELRTPLTGLHAAAELLPLGRPTELVQDRVRALCRLTEDLLEISRLDARIEHADLDEHQLGPIAERAVRASGLETEVRIVQDIRVETDRRRLERVLGNLVANAHKHGETPVILTVDGPDITVRDHGPGYPDYLLETGPQRFRTRTTSSGRTGHGLGLTIAEGQARTLGADFELTNAPDGGAVATLRLPTQERLTRE
ncbi:ATP-binding protein [Streptomyces sp. NPDC015125]|uniref:ATP-binding protein n=1 Tax=Streptomyces sp. NPDC015125 TaxID=3364938 RepID=UPI003702B5B9